MDLLIEKVGKPLSGQSLQITGSKSESNRLLILKQLFPELHIENLSTSDDTVHLSEVLKTHLDLLDIGHAGTAMRFGTAYFATQEGANKTITGSDRMKQRPIGVLVDALRNLGAQISYLDEPGFPPLHMQGTSISGGAIAVDGSVSSQFITALLLVAPSFEKGIQVVINEPTSVPYLMMTYRMIKELGIKAIWDESKHGQLSITVPPTARLLKNAVTVESDWSSAGYWYSWVALQETGYYISLDYYREDSLQGDSRLQGIYKSFGVRTTFMEGKMTLRKIDQEVSSNVTFDLRDVPDQAQTIFATCLGLGIHAHLTGLHTLKIKETDRIEAMRIVGSRFRESEITTTNHSITLKILSDVPFNDPVTVDTYHDHRMALAFAPLCIKTSLLIKDAGVVSKSYGGYWEDLNALNVGISER